MEHRFLAGPPDGQGQGGGRHLPATPTRHHGLRAHQAGRRPPGRAARKRGRVGAGAIHGDLRQTDREKALADFPTGKLPVLVATDVAARGLHVDDVDIVIHFDPPEDHKAYLHRSGRTARAGEAGMVVTLVLWDQELEVERIQKRIGADAAHRRDVLQRPPPGRPGRLGHPRSPESTVGGVGVIGRPRPHGRLRPSNDEEHRVPDRTSSR